MRSMKAASLGRSARTANVLKIAGRDGAADQQERPRDVQHQEPVERAHGCETYAVGRMETRDRHLKLLTETIEAVNSTLDLQEVLAQVATNVASALEADACFVYLYDERADELVLRATHGTRVDEMTRRPRHAAGRGDHRLGGVRARAGDARVAGAPRSALQALPEPARGRVRVDPRGADPDPRRHARGRAERADARAARVRRGRGRAAARDRGAGRAVDRAREAVRRGAAARARARGARADLGGRLELALPRGVARGDRQDDDGRALGDGRGARARRRPDRVARGRRRQRTRCASRCAGAGGRSASSWPIARRRSPKRTASCSRRSRPTPPSRSSTAAPSCAACSRRRSITV